MHAYTLRKIFFFFLFLSFRDGLKWNRTTERMIYGLSECVYCNSSSGTTHTRAGVWANDVCVCVCVPSRSHYRYTTLRSAEMMIDCGTPSVPLLGAWWRYYYCSYYPKKHAQPSWFGSYYPLTFILRPLSSWRRGTCTAAAPPPRFR